MSLHLHFSLRSVLRARDVKLGKGNAVTVHFINDEHLVAEIKEDLSANVLLLVSGGIRTFRIHVSVFSFSHLWWRAYLSYTHLIGGEGAGLVRADDWSAAQSLHRGQTPDNGIFLGHATGSQSQAGGDDSGQACDMGTGIRQRAPGWKIQSLQRRYLEYGQMSNVWPSLRLGP